MHATGPGSGLRIAGDGGLCYVFRGDRNISGILNIPQGKEAGSPGNPFRDPLLTRFSTINQSYERRDSIRRERGDYIRRTGTEENLLPFYHHCMPFSQVQFGTITATREYSYTDFLPAYEWLEQEIGFYPHFLATGNLKATIRRTGYEDNWRVFDHGEFTGTGYRKMYRGKGEFPNKVLFSFDDMEGVFMDELSWNIAINARMNGKPVSDREMNMILKPSWNRRRWIHVAEKNLLWVCLLVPELPLDRASMVSVRNLATKKALEKQGFRDIRTLRIPVEKMPF